MRTSARRAGDDGLAIESEYLLGISAFWGGALEEARAHLDAAVHGFRPEQLDQHLLRFGHDPRIVCLSRLGNTLWFLGDDEAARRARAGALDLASEMAHPYSRSVTLVFAALLAVDLGEGDLVRRYAAALAGERVQARPNEIKAVALVGLAEALDGRVNEGLRRIRSAIDLCGPVNPAPGFRAALMRVLVAAHEVAGDAAGGLRATDEALALGGSRLWEAETRRLRAAFLAAVGGSPVEVEVELAWAADVARRQGAVGPGRRIEESLSRMRAPG